MKKVLFTLILMTTMSLAASAQDGFFRGEVSDGGGTRAGETGIMMPQHDQTTDQNAAPLGSGLLVLTALGAGYAALSKKQ